MDCNKRNTVDFVDGGGVLAVAANIYVDACNVATGDTVERMAIICNFMLMSGFPQIVCRLVFSRYVATIEVLRD